MIALPALHSFKKLPLSYRFLATSSKFFDHDTRVMLKEITSEKGKALSGNYQVNFFTTKMRDTCNDISHCFNSQKNNLSLEVKRVLL